MYAYVNCAQPFNKQSAKLCKGCDMIKPTEVTEHTVHLMDVDDQLYVRWAEGSWYRCSEDMDFYIDDDTFASELEETFQGSFK